MMPPKKSKAARGQAEKLEKEGKHNGVEIPDRLPPAMDCDDITDEEPRDDAVSNSDEKEPAESVNIFKETIVEGKRKRDIPPGEKHLSTWIDDNIEAKEENHVNMSQLYEEYVESCVGINVPAAEQHKFYRIIKEQFPKGLTMKESSVLFGVVKDRKIRPKDPKTKVQADSLRLKMSDIISTGLKELGNPKVGIQFRRLLNWVAVNYPALQITLRPNQLNSALQAGVRYGKILCLRGIGRCGVYRLPPTEEELKLEEEEEEKRKQERKEKKEKKSEDAVKDGETEAKPEENGEEEVKKEEEEEDTGSKRVMRKRKAPEPAKKAGGKKKKGQKGKGKGKAKPKRYRRFIVHSDPQRIEDTFQMAMTYMNEPKTASVAAMKRYISKYYDVDDVDTKIKKVLESGLEKGYWTQVTGSGVSSGSYQLEADEFDPEWDETLMGQTLIALVACAEPKECSAHLLKRYVIEYHPDFKVADRPHLFKQALERGVNKDLIIQLSGIGATGSFQLFHPFTPTPAQLQGRDQEDDYASDTSDESESESESELEYAMDPDSFKDKYKPRPTKSRGGGRGRTTVSAAPQRKPPAKRAPAPAKKKAPAAKAETPKQTKKSQAKKSTSRRRK